jgi:trimethylamine--corrinoid protein Co-methyltransferase
MVEGLGLLRAATLLVPEQIIFDDEIYNTHRILADGIDTCADQLAVDVIEQVGPGGHFLAQKHTRRTIRDIWLPKLTHPNPNSNEIPQDVRMRAREKFRNILTKHHPDPLPQDIQIELQKILRAAGQEIG